MLIIYNMKILHKN